MQWEHLHARALVWTDPVRVISTALLLLMMILIMMVMMCYKMKNGLHGCGLMSAHFLSFPRALGDICASCLTWREEISIQSYSERLRKSPSDLHYTPIHVIKPTSKLHITHRTSNIPHRTPHITHTALCRRIMLLKRSCGSESRTTHITPSFLLMIHAVDSSFANGSEPVSSCADGKVEWIQQERFSTKENSVSDQDLGQRQGNSV